MSLMGYCYGPYQNDPLNTQRRLASETDRMAFNCAGYALGSMTWYCPLMDGFTAEERTRHAIESILADFPNVRRVSSLDEVGKNECAIAFRIESRGADFHFCMRTPRGCWYHKQGTHAICRITEERVFAEYWPSTFLRYDGPIVLFARSIY